MEALKTQLAKYYAPLILGVLILILLIPNSPHFVPVSGADPGVFVYIGDQILDGDIPYRDHFGNKGPLTFYLNALGLLLRRGSLWGVWSVQLGLLYAAALIAFKAMRKTFGKWPALLGSLAWIMQLSLILRGGNFTEEYAILFQFGAFLLFVLSLEKPAEKVYPILIGISLAMGFLLRPNNIGISASIIILLGIAFLAKKEERKAIFNQAFLIMLGFLGIILLVAAYFLSQGALAQLIEGVFLFNLSLNLTEGSSLNAIFAGMDRLSLIFPFALIAWALALTQSISDFAKSQKVMSIRALMAVALPVEIILATIGGKAITHYYISWIPILGLLSAYFAYSLQDAISGRHSIGTRKLQLSSIWLLAFALAISLIPLNKQFPPTSDFFLTTLREGRLTRGDYSPQDAQTVELITKILDEDEYLLIWGFELKYYFMANRESPSRFAYQYPFIAPGFATQAMIDELIHDIATKKPLIVDSSISDGSGIPWIGAPRWDTVPGMDQVMTYIFANYSVTSLVGPEKWPVYQYVGTD
jgi:hypothetical protein